jgi:3-oxoadipate enol-lactonase
MTPEIAITAPVGPTGADLVVLGPSLGTSTILWENVVPALVTRYRVIAWDLPGHGAAPAATEPFTVGDLADAVAAAVRSLGASRIRYAGVSLGGATGLELCLRHPELVTAAAVVASGAQLNSPESWRDRAAKVREQSTSSIIVPSAQVWFAPDSMARIPELSGRLLHVLQDADDESYARCCEALAGYDVRGRLGEIVAPLRVQWGEHDRVATEAKAREIVGGARWASAVMIADAAHLPPAEQPAVVAADLLAFFDTAFFDAAFFNTAGSDASGGAR